MTLSHYLSEEELRALLKEEVADMPHEADPFNTIEETVTIDPQFLYVLNETVKNLAGRVASLENEVNRLRLELVASIQTACLSVDSEESLSLEAEAASGEHAQRETALAPRAERHRKKNKGILEKLFD